MTRGLMVESHGENKRQEEMYMKKTKKFLALGLALALALTSLTGCGSSETDTKVENSAADEQKTSSEATNQDSSTGSGEKLVVGLTTSSFVTDYDNNYFTNYLEEKLGFELEFYMLPADAAETRTKVALMATSNEDLPDVLVVDGMLTNEMILQYGESGFFLPIEDYLNDASVMPYYNEIPEEDRATIQTATTMANGHIYGFAAYEPETWNLTPYRMFINKAWLDKLGLDVPTTTDELKDVLIAFRDNDPNGNGVQDEIGVYGFSAGGYGQNVSYALMNAFTFYNGDLALAEDDTVYAPYTTEEWREGLRYMNDLFNEGVLSANIFTDDEQTFKAVLNQETPIVGLVTIGSLSNYPDAVNNANFLEMEFIEPLTGPEGVQYTPYTPYNPGQEGFILSSTDKLDMALKFMDLFFEHDTSLVERFGEEGVDWTRDPADLEGQTNAYVEAGLYDGLSMLVISTMWADNQSQTWRNHGPRYASLEMGNTVYDYSAGVKYDSENPTNLSGQNYAWYYTKHPEKVLPSLKYTMEEAEAIQDQLTTIPDFVKQALAEFVTGARDIESGWDTYLSELETMGLEKYLETAQAAYDRVK